MWWRFMVEVKCKIGEMRLRSLHRLPGGTVQVRVQMGANLLYLVYTYGSPYSNVLVPAAAVYAAAVTIDIATHDLVGMAS